MVLGEIDYHVKHLRQCGETLTTASAASFGPRKSRIMYEAVWRCVDRPGIARFNYC